MFEQRRKSRVIRVGRVEIGGGAPISVQTMANADPNDLPALLAQVARLASADIVRLTVPDKAAAKNLAKVKEAFPDLPLVADIHFDWRLAIESAAAGADKIRINPGNIGDESRVKAVADECRARGLPIRVGVNSGSVAREILAKHGGATPEALAESALSEIAALERFDFRDICVSVKSTSVASTVRANLLVAEATDVPLHIGVTEAGTIRLGEIKSAAGIGGLLALGIGDTLRVSLTGAPEPEIASGRRILRAMGLSGGVDVVSCPTCGRTKVDVERVASELAERTESLSARGGRTIKVAVMGCAVNGPGEAREADVGVAGGDGEWLLFRRGEIVGKLAPERVVDALADEIKRLL